MVRGQALNEKTNALNFLTLSIPNKQKQIGLAKQRQQNASTKLRLQMQNDCAQKSDQTLI